LTNDDATKDGSAGEITGPVYLPLRQRPASATATGGRTPDNTTRDAEAATDRPKRSAADRLWLAPTR
jgi:hypothetical protein